MTGQELGVFGASESDKGGSVTQEFSAKLQNLLSITPVIVLQSYFLNSFQRFV